MAPQGLSPATPPCGALGGATSAAGAAALQVHETEWRGRRRRNGIRPGKTRRGGRTWRQGCCSARSRVCSTRCRHTQRADRGGAGRPLSCLVRAGVRVLGRRAPPAGEDGPACEGAVAAERGGWRCFQWVPPGSAFAEATSRAFAVDSAGGGRSVPLFTFLSL